MPKMFSPPRTEVDMKAYNLVQNNATHLIGQSFQENVLLKNIARFSMSSISFHHKSK